MASKSRCSYRCGNTSGQCGGLPHSSQLQPRWMNQIGPVSWKPKSAFSTLRNSDSTADSLDSRNCGRSVAFLHPQLCARGAAGREMAQISLPHRLLPLPSLKMTARFFLCRSLASGGYRGKNSHRSAPLPYRRTTPLGNRWCPTAVAIRAVHRAAILWFWSRRPHYHHSRVHSARRCYCNSAERHHLA